MTTNRLTRAPAETQLGDLAEWSVIAVMVVSSCQCSNWVIHFGLPDQTRVDLEVDTPARTLRRPECRTKGATRCQVGAGSGGRRCACPPYGAYLVLDVFLIGIGIGIGIDSDPDTDIDPDGRQTGDDFMSDIWAPLY
jgi:hypothetical protein